MPRQKELLTRKKKTDRKRANEIPQSENEYLAAGVDFEEAGEKWRAGDATKSLRFFNRAIENYHAGLQKFPHSFDLAYNKARLQYDVTQHPRLLEQLPNSLIDLLQTALDSHRTALGSQQDSPDLLFNTAQVLTSLAEAIFGGRKSSASEQDHAVHLLQEALDLFQRCLNLQEVKYNHAQENAVRAVRTLAADNDDSEQNLSDNSKASDASEEEVWALVEEPVTKDTLFDTAIAQLDTLTSICTVGACQRQDLAWIEEYYHTVLQAKISFYGNSPSHQHEVALSNAKFISAVSDAALRNGRFDLLLYERELDAAFDDPRLRLEPNVQGLCDRADAELTFNASTQASVEDAQQAERLEIATICWKHITKALDSLTAASILPEALSLPSIHLRRGDCELSRYRLAEEPLCYDLAIKSKRTLLKNAEVYYRGATNTAKSSKDNEEVRKEARVKEAIATCLNNNDLNLRNLIEADRQYVQAIVEEMNDEHILGDLTLQIITNLLT